MSSEKFYALCGTVCFCVMAICITISEVLKAL